MMMKITPLESWAGTRIGTGPGALGAEDLAMYQLMKLRETVKSASENSTFYRDNLKKYQPADISSYSEFADLPFTTEADIRDQGLKMLCVSRDEIHRVVTLDSSGTTGNPKRIYFTEDDQELTVDFFMHGMATFTAPGDRVMILLPCERPGSVGDLLAKALERLGASPVRYGIVKNIPDTLRVISGTGANIIAGIPVQVLALAVFHEQNPVQGIGIERILLTTDNVPCSVATELNRVFRSEIFNHYGMTEMGLGGGVDCCCHGGYHLREADLYFEIIDPDTGEPVKNGDTGEVVFTTLTRRGMPLIRYRTGDMSRFIPGNCPCGSTLRRLDYIRVRKSGVISINENCKLAISDLDEKLLSLHGILDYKVTVIKNPSGLIFKIKIFCLGNELPGEEINRTLRNIPSLSRALSAGLVKPEIESVQCGNEYIPGYAKRTITLRNF